MKSFDEWYKEAKKSNDDGFSAKGFFEAGQQSKQAEIDELRFQRDVLSNKVDELRKRIDEVLNKSEDFYDFGDGESAMAFCNEIINILKGDQS